jgi:Oxidoreductase molybdopterin binding domain
MFARLFQAIGFGAALLAGGLAAHADETALIVHAAGGDAVKLSAAEIRKLPAQRIHATPEHRAGGDYDCTPLAGVLSSTGAVPEKSLRGKRMADYLRVAAADGYEVAFALPEIDPEFTDRQVLLCYAKDGAPLAADEGPLRLIVPGEKRQARWVRGVTGLFVERK